MSHRGGNHRRRSDLGFVVERGNVWCALDCSMGGIRGPMFEKDWGQFVGEVHIS